MFPWSCWLQWDLNELMEMTSCCNAPNWVWNGASSCATHSSGIHLLKWMLFSVTGPGCCWPCHSHAVKNIAQESNKPASGTLVYATWRLCLSDHCMQLEHILLWITQHELSSQTNHFQLNNKSASGTPILQAEASFTSAETGLHQQILSQTSLKHHNHFQIMSKACDFHLQTTQKACGFWHGALLTWCNAKWFCRVLHLLSVEDNILTDMHFAWSMSANMHN